MSPVDVVDADSLRLRIEVWQSDWLGESVISERIRQSTQLNISKLAVPGELSFIDVDLIAEGFANGLFDQLENLTVLTIQHSRVSTLLVDVFKNLHAVHTLNLDHNTFTYVKETVFRNMTALSKVSFAGIPWQCTCSNLWFMTTFSDRGISFQSEVVCDEPRSWAGMRASNYIVDVCEDKKCEQGTIPSIDLGVLCLTYLQVVIYIAAFVAFLKLLSVIFMCYKTRKQAFGDKDGGSTKKGIRMMTPRKPPPRQRAPVAHTRSSKQWLYHKGSGQPGASYA